MALDFKQFNGTENNTLTDLGTVKTAVGKGGSISLVRKNWNDPTKRVAIILQKADGKSMTIACSKQLSDALRSNKLKLNHLIGLNIIEDEKGRNFISMPATGALQTISVDKLKTATIETEEATFLPEELLAL